MQRLAWIALAALLVGAMPADAAGLAFHQPASFAAAELESKTVQWALLVFHNETEAIFNLESSPGIALSNDTVHYALVARSVDAKRLVEGLDSHSSRRIAGPVKLQAGFVPGQSGSALIVAERLDFELQDAAGTLRTKPDGRTLEGFSRPEDLGHDLYRKGRAPGGNDVVVLASPARAQSSFQLQAHGETTLEWYNAAVTCSTTDCPDGGGPTILQVGNALGQSVTSEYHTYETLEGISKLKARGTLDYAVLGSANLTVSLAGSVRLPLATTTDVACETCLSPDRQTLAAAGNITLSGLHMASDGSISGDVGGDIEAARLDEAVIDPDLLFRGGMAFGVAAAVGGFAALYYSFGPLFTWNREEDLLSNPRRRRIYEVVIRNPGICTREALRAADVPAGSGRHHVNRMVEAGLLMAQRDQAVMLLFENHGRYKETWRHMATLRNPHSRHLMEWLSAHHGSPQKAILDAFEAEYGWNRSTTQKRLNRLQRDGMVEARTYGRYKVYAVVKPRLSAPLVEAPPMLAGRPAA
ncbi:MAG: BlaI/MecI/CopY family transcriptional regulator [Thermoplasmatota archaeon]